MSDRFPVELPIRSDFKTILVNQLLRFWKKKEKEKLHYFPPFFFPPFLNGLGEANSTSDVCVLGWHGSTRLHTPIQERGRLIAQHWRTCTDENGSPTGHPNWRGCDSICRDIARAEIQPSEPNLKVARSLIRHTRSRPKPQHYQHRDLRIIVPGQELPELMEESQRASEPVKASWPTKPAKAVEISKNVESEITRGGFL